MAGKRMTPEQEIKVLDEKLEKHKEKEKATKDKFKEERTQILNRKKLAKQKIATEKKKAETARLCMKARLLEKHMEANPHHEFTIFMNKLLDQYITEPRDREICGLKPRIA